MTDLLKIAEQHGYTNAKVLANGEVAGICRYLYTAGIVIGIDAISWRTRYCYERYAQAAAALEQWDGTGDPPGPWIKQKPEERHGPGLAAEELES